MLQPLLGRARSAGRPPGPAAQPKRSASPRAAPGCCAGRHRAAAAGRRWVKPNFSCSVPIRQAARGLQPCSRYSTSSRWSVIGSPLASGGADMAGFRWTCGNEVASPGFAFEPWAKHGPKRPAIEGRAVWLSSPRAWRSCPSAAAGPSPGRERRPTLTGERRPQSDATRLRHPVMVGTPWAKHRIAADSRRWHRAGGDRRRARGPAGAGDPRARPRARGGGVRLGLGLLSDPWPDDARGWPSSA